ncbi:YigZ family protein [Paradesulfitobacterium ferrireducens]|uniref:YigZ family protein n=1 Tax=Paradesulfitobacterium ferrireducens TaxID=2816476 RepID=UPI001A8F4CD4|nr:YigZ family protein [Paradesulfitobacterium ferrireducens]
MHSDHFFVVPETRTWEQVIDKSRFIGIATPVANSQEIEDAFQAVREQYPNARHYVYAYRLKEGLLERASDDGEPQGTGGRPILDVLQHKQIWNVLVIVVRYFGGILLGTGGLTRAYGSTAREVLELAPLKMLQPFVVFQLKISYAWYDQLRYHLSQRGWETGKETFLEFIELEVYIPLAEAEGFGKWLTELTAGQVAWERDAEVWRPGN